MKDPLHPFSTWRIFRILSIPKLGRMDEEREERRGGEDSIKKKIYIYFLEINVLDFGMGWLFPSLVDPELSVSSFTTLEEKVARRGHGWNGGPRTRERGRGIQRRRHRKGVEQTSALSKGYLAVSDLTRRDYRRKRKNAYHLSTTNRAKIRSLSRLSSSRRTREENGVGKGVLWNCKGYFFVLDNLRMLFVCGSLWFSKMILLVFKI